MIGAAKTCERCSRPHWRPESHATVCLTCLEDTPRASNGNGVVVLPSARNAATTTTRYTGRRVDIAAMLAKPPQPIPWRVHGLVADGTLTIAAGEAGSGKTWLAQALCVGVKRGHSVAGMPCVQGRALYIDGEMGARMFVERLRASDVGAEFELRDAMGLDLSKPDDLAWLRGEIKATGAQFVVIDSLRRLTPSQPENDSDAMAPVISAIAKLARDTNAAILLTHHKGDSEKYYRGSTAIRDQCDALFALLRDSEDDNDPVRRLTCSGGKGKMRYAPETPDRFLTIAPEHGGVEEADRPAMGAKLSAREIVKQKILGNLPCGTKTEAARRIGRALNDRTFREVWAELERAGLIAQTRDQGVVVVELPREKTTTTPLHLVESGGSIVIEGDADLGPELNDGSLADALPAEPCRCERPLPAPDEGEIRCTRCGHACDWGVPA